MTEKEAPEGKSLEQPNLKDELATMFDNLADDEQEETKDEPEEPEEGKEEEPDSGESPEPEEPVEAAEDTEQEEDHPEEGEESELEIEAHLPEDFKEVVKKLDPEDAQVILKTNKTSENRANAKFEQAAEARKFFDEVGVERLKPVLSQVGIEPATYFNRLLTVEQAFRDQPSKTIAVMIQEAKRMGVKDFAEIEAVLGANPSDEDAFDDPKYKGLQDKVSGLEAKVTQSEQLSARRQREELSTQIETFKNEKTKDGKLAHPHFDRVEDAMAGLFRSGQARSLQEAYDKAVRLDDELFNGLLTEKEKSVIKAREAERKKSVQKSKAASRNVTGKKPSSPEKNYPKDIRETLGQVYDELSG